MAAEACVTSLKKKPSLQKAKNTHVFKQKQAHTNRTQRTRYEEREGPTGVTQRDKSDRRKVSLSVFCMWSRPSAFWDALLPVWCLWDGLIHIASSLPWALRAPHRDIKEHRERRWREGGEQGWDQEGGEGRGRQKKGKQWNGRMEGKEEKGEDNKGRLRERLRE